MRIKKLKNIKIENFRIFKEIDCPLDSDIVLISGQNRAGKSSFLNAIELAICGDVKDLSSLEDDYPKCAALINS